MRHFAACSAFVCVFTGSEIAEQNKDGGRKKHSNEGWISADLRGNKSRGEMRNWKETEEFQGMRVISRSFVFLGLRNEKGMAWLAGGQDNFADLAVSRNPKIA